MRLVNVIKYPFRDDLKVLVLHGVSMVLIRGGLVWAVYGGFWDPLIWREAGWVNLVCLWEPRVKMLEGAYDQ